MGIKHVLYMSSVGPGRPVDNRLFFFSCRKDKRTLALEVKKLRATSHDFQLRCQSMNAENTKLTIEGDALRKELALLKAQREFSFCY